MGAALSVLLALAPDALPPMPALTRRRSKGRHAESWQIFYGDVQIGTIGIRAGVPVDVDQWGWSCGFYPRSHPLEHGTAGTF